MCEQLLQFCKAPLPHFLVPETLLLLKMPQWVKLRMLLSKQPSKRISTKLEMEVNVAFHQLKVIFRCRHLRYEPRMVSDNV